MYYMQVSPQSPFKPTRHLRVIALSSYHCVGYRRIRRVKCDEKKPICHRCSSAGRKCDGYAVQQAAADNDNRFALQRRTCNAIDFDNLLLDLHGTREELRSLDFFRSRTAPILSGYFDSNFWNRLLLQVCHSEPTIRGAVMAVSSIHKQYEAVDALALEHDGLNQLADANHRFALQQYNAAISSLTSRLSRKQLSVEVLLMTCVFFICLEFLRGNEDAAIAHLQSGARILCAHREKGSQLHSGELLDPSSDPQFVEDIFVPIFARLNILSSLFGRPAPELFPKPKNSVSEIPFSPPNSFSNLVEARTSIINLVSLVLHFVRSTVEYRYDPKDGIDFIIRQLEIDAQLQQWSRALENSWSVR